MGALARSDSGPHRVLLVDDDPVLRRVTCALIERRLGVEVTPAHGGMEALSLLRRNDYHAVVIDLEMPEMGGLELLGRLRALFPELIVGVWSGRASTPDLEGTQVRFVVRKTESVDALVEALRFALDLPVSSSGSFSWPPEDA